MSNLTVGPLGSFRLNTRTAQPRTSSNKTFQEQFRGGLKSGIDISNSAFRQITRPIPGASSLSASISQAAQNLSGPSSLDGGTELANAIVDGDAGSLQGEVLKNNQDMLEQQLKISQITTMFSTRSNILRTVFETLKTIGSNIR
jgi:hypothetical protein